MIEELWIFIRLEESYAGGGIRNLYEMVMNQRESKCIMNGLCPFYFKHRGYGWSIGIMVVELIQKLNPSKLILFDCLFERF